MSVSCPHPSAVIVGNDAPLIQEHAARAGAARQKWR
jgi:hypothetical protein